MLNEAFGWAWICLGIVTGAWIGIGFKRDDHMGGYDSWRRRLVRLGHIAFFGTGILNILFSETSLRWLAVPRVYGTAASWSMIVGAVLMPTICFLSAYNKKAAALFFLPVLALAAGCAGTATLLVWMALQ